MGRAARASDDDPEARIPGTAREVEQAFGRAVGGDDPVVMGDAERIERRGGMAHGRPVGLAAHDDGDGRGDGAHG